MQHLTGARVHSLKFAKVLAPAYFSLRDAQQALKTSERVAITVSGVRYETLASTLDRYPETILGTDAKRKIMMRDENCIVEFRSHVAFEAILFFYQSSGNLVRPEQIPMKDFVNECNYYQLPEKAVNRMKNREAYLNEIIENEHSNPHKACILNFIDYPKKSTCKLASYIYVLLSMSLMLMSIVVICVESEVLLLKRFRQINEFREICHNFEMGLNVFFTLELLLRFLVHPIPKSFFTKALNAVELISVGGFFIFYNSLFKYSTVLLNGTRSLRAIRLARLSRLSGLVKIVALVFKMSFWDIIAVGYVLLIVSILNGSIMFYIEMNVPNTEFTCIPQAMWWALQTVICLGYGDIVPTSVPGKLVGAVLMIIGVIIMTVLILSLGGRFFDSYSKELYQKEFLPKEDNIDYEIHYRAFKELKQSKSNESSVYKKTSISTRNASKDNKRRESVDSFRFRTSSFGKTSPRNDRRPSMGRISSPNKIHSPTEAIPRKCVRKKAIVVDLHRPKELNRGEENRGAALNR